ncbi:HAD-IIIA family hydrolase, partial [Candidatus Saccharibacteria bacterium]|nr:HAD-IIIA family hydrolase [Candidatus Saccharibacteria bacterium]
LKPDYIVDSVCDVDFDLLKKQGIKAVMIDLDGTVVSRGSFDVDKKLTTYLRKQSIDIYIATNRPKGRTLKNLKESLNAKGVIHPVGIHAKPMPGYFKHAAASHKLKPSEVAMIGDRYLQDISGANRAGLTTILVRKLGVSKGFIDRRISSFEKKRTDRLAAGYVTHSQTKI